MSVLDQARETCARLKLNRNGHAVGISRSSGVYAENEINAVIPETPKNQGKIDQNGPGGARTEYAVNPAGGVESHKQGYAENAVNAVMPEPVEPWDQAKAEVLLADLRRDLARIERDLHCGRFPEIIARLVADGLSICRTLADHHDLEGQRGWNTLDLMRQSAALTLRIARGEKPPALGPIGKDPNNDTALR